MVSLNHIGSNHFCGGSIIAENKILTAAHCVTLTNPASIDVQAGSTNVSCDGSRKRVSRIIIHPYYYSFKYENDLAILVLRTPLKYSRNIQPIALPERLPDLHADALVQVTGWGRTGDERRPDILKMAELKIVEQDDCIRAYEDIDIEVESSMVCAANSDDGGKDSCQVCLKTKHAIRCKLFYFFLFQGDSGGPLVYLPKGKAPVLYGIVSFGAGCAQPGFPGVYTRVSSFLDWIMPIVYQKGI